MKKKLFLLPFLLVTINSFCQQTLYVSDTSPYKTLLQAYDAIAYENGVIDQSYEILIDADEVEIGDFGDGVYWEKSGNSNYSITIKPSDNVFNPKLTKSQGVLSRNYSIDFKNVENVHISGLTFANSQAGIHLINANSCSIESCVFIIEYPDDLNDSGGAAIEIKGEGQNYSTGNLIKSNLIYSTEHGLEFVGLTNYTWHGIYLGDNTVNNIIEYNSIFDALANGVQTWHTNVTNNLVNHNFITVNSLSNDTLLKRHNILIGRQPDGNVEGNTVSNNFINSKQENISVNRQSNYDSFSQRGNHNNLLIQEGIKITNTTKDNVEFFYNVDNEIAIDPKYFSNWINVDLGMDIVGVLSGNFDGGSDNEIAVLFDVGGNSTQIHVWKKVEMPSATFLKYSGLWWRSNEGSFDANKVAGRLVVGDFTGEGRDDIVGIRDLGNGNSKIVLWAGSSAGRFNSESSLSPYIRWTSNPGAFDANQLTGRLVAGDFSGDGRIDIAGLRDEGNGNSKIVLWAGRSDGHFGPDGYAYTRWTSNSGAFEANQLTGRLVAGDFSGDGRIDIAGLRDEGNGNSKIVLWAGRSDGHFGPDGYAYTRWTSNPGAFEANQLTGRLVAGDFSGDGRIDIAGLRDEGNGNSKIVLWAGRSDGHFGPDGYAYTRWTSNQGEFKNEDAKSVIAIDNSIVAFSHQVQDNKDYRIISWDNDNGYFDKTNDMNFIPWIIDYNSELYFNDKPTNGGRMALEETITSLELDREKDLKLIFYPNPASSDFNVSFSMDQKGILNISVIDLSGKEVFQKTQEYELGSHILEIKFEGIKSGLYSVHGTIGDHSFANKIFIRN